MMPACCCDPPVLWQSRRLQQRLADSIAESRRVLSNAQDVMRIEAFSPMYVTTLHCSRATVLHASRTSPCAHRCHCSAAAATQGSAPRRALVLSLSWTSPTQAYRGARKPLRRLPGEPSPTALLLRSPLGRSGDPRKFQVCGRTILQGCAA